MNPHSKTTSSFLVRPGLLAWSHRAGASSYALSALIATAVAQAQPVVTPKPDMDGFVDARVIHRLADDVPSKVGINPFGPMRETAPAAAKGAPTAGSTTASAYPISFHGGPVMGSISKLVLIWYGNWNQGNGTDTPAGQQIIRDAIYGLSQPNATYNYAGITTGYSSSLGLYTSGATAVTQIASPKLVEYTQATSKVYGGATLTDNSVFALVKAYAGSPPDPAAIHLVLSSSEIAESSGFLTKYCGWHSYGSVSGVKLKYAFVGNPNRKLSACAVQSTSPNGNAAVDAMVSVIAHELIETVTDPELNAWYNSQGQENSDMCAWTFGPTNALPNGAYWNVSLPNQAGQSKTYLLQRQLSSTSSKCYINATGPIQ